jgi:hypothetical protein
MTLRVSEPMPDWWDDELDVLSRRCVAVFGEDATDDTLVRVTEHYCGGVDIEEAPFLEGLVPILVETLKGEVRRLLTPH